jgi:hypothetical protein
MLELGTSLSQARLARGFTLEEVERSTRISKRFLIALEEHDYSVFPAPVYARGFLRIYCRFLGIDPEEQLSQLPLAWTQTTPQLPQVSRPVMVNYKWLGAGMVIVAIAVALIYFSGRQRGLDDLTQPEAPLTQNEPRGQDPAPVVTTRQIEATAPGILPNLAGVALTSAIEFLEQRQLSYLVIEAADQNTPAGVVMSQTPQAGAGAQAGSRVTLTVSTGTSQAGPMRTDCNALQASTRRTAAEQTWFESNCQTPATPGDRRSCQEIQGTPYRSLTERDFYRANCIS